MLEARHFTVLTDHKQLTFAFHQRKDKYSPRQCNHLDFISQFTTDIRHISSQENIVANALSRIEAIAAHVTHDVLAAAQRNDEELQTLQSDNRDRQLTKLTITGISVKMYSVTSTGKPRPYVPSSLRRQIFDSLHSLSHP